MVGPDINQQDVNVLASGAGWSIGGKISGRLLSVIGDIILARTLGAGIFGLFSIGLTLFRIVSMLVPMGFPQGVIKFIPRFIAQGEKSKIKGLIISATGLSFISGLLIGIIFFLLAPWLSESIFLKPSLVPVFRLFSMAFPFVSLLTVTSGISRSKQKIIYSAIIEDFGQPLIYLLGLIFLFFTTGLFIYHAIAAEILSLVVAGLIGAVLVSRVFSEYLSTRDKPDYSIIREIMTYSLPTSFAGVFSVFVFWVDRLIVGLLLPSEQNGIYQVVSQLSMVFVILYAAFNAILTPIFSNLFTNSEKDRLEEIFKVGTKWNFYLGLIPFIFYLVFSQEILGFIFGKEYIAGWMALIALAFGQLINCVTGSIGALLMMTGNQKTWFRITLVTFAINALLSFFLVSKVGIFGAALGTTLSVSGMNFSALMYAKKELGIWPYDRRYIKGIIVATIVIFISILVKNISIPSGLSLFLNFGLIIICFVFGIFLFRLDSEDILLISLFKARIGFRFPTKNRR